MDTEKDNGVNEENAVNPLGDNEVRKPEMGLNTSGMIQKMRRGTDSHKTEETDERADLFVRYQRR